MCQMIHLRHTHTHITIPLITCHRTPDSFACSIEMPTHNFRWESHLLFIMFSHTLRLLHITALRGSILYVQTHLLVCVCEMCRYLYRNKCTTLIPGSDKDSSIPFFYVHFFSLNAVSARHQCISPGKAQQTSTFCH